MSQSTVDAPRFPDFIIAGAMKSGTSSLHAMLAEHPRIFIPPGEVGFFDHDDFCEHIDYFVTSDGVWRDRDFDEQLDERLVWYRSLFATAQPDQLAGVDSTTYLSSRAAPARIARHIPHARIVILLREPASRAYSQYWHMLRAGSMLYSFEDSLRLMPERILTRSYYVAAVRRYLECFPRRQLHFVAFESFIRDPSAGVNNALAFLGLGGSEFRPSASAWHSNPARLARSQLLQMHRNRWRWRNSPSGHVQHPGDSAAQLPSNSRNGNRLRIGARMVSQTLNPHDVRRTPPMREDTRRFLTALLRRENQGLSELVGLDLDHLWYES